MQDHFVQFPVTCGPCAVYVYCWVLTVMSIWVEGFLELINNMLTSGMVPALYADDEKEAIVGQVPV